MTTELTVFNFDHDTNIRTVMINGEPNFVAKDICDALDIVNNNGAITTLKENYDKIGVDTGRVVNSYPILDALGRLRETTIVTEAGLYDLIAQSRKPNALKFKYWVHSDVLPAIRKYSIDIPKSLPEALRLYANELEMKELVIKQRDEAIRTKAQIGSKREATAMAHTAVLKKENEKLKTQIGNSERYKQVTAILWLKEFFYIKKPSFHSQVGTQLSRLSKNLEIATIDVESIKYNTVKAYDINVINYFKQQLMEDKDKTIMTKYRLN